MPTHLRTHADLHVRVCNAGVACIAAAAGGSTVNLTPTTNPHLNPSGRGSGNAEVVDTAGASQSAIEDDDECTAEARETKNVCISAVPYRMVQSKAKNTQQHPETTAPRRKAHLTGLLC